ncbi:glycosyltransferase [Roseibium polysiphoniae]|uniref:Glycosyltransferase n=1 Tax=Roseibium polysiphoniae TaxID=2571221 RepID=A0A944CFG7_9HYPH|nr:glycosyltransferase [Roseibium polysiphoniae]
MLVQELDAGLPLGADRVEIGPLEILRMDRAAVISLSRSSVLLRKPLDVAICNAHTILTALDDSAFCETLQQMTLLNDGIGANLASRYLHGVSFPDNLNGTDLVPDILENIGIPLRIYMLGAKDDELKLAKAHLEARYPLHTVVGARNGYFSPDQADAVCQVIADTNPDLLLVGMGNPRQEQFLVDNRAKLNVTVSIGVGALFDFMSGRVVRAPKFVRALGLEWLFRLLQEPKRLFQRYIIGIPRFFLALRRLKRLGNPT